MLFNIVRYYLPNPLKACKTIAYIDIKVVYIFAMVVNYFVDFEIPIFITSSNYLFFFIVLSVSNF